MPKYRRSFYRSLKSPALDSARQVLPFVFGLVRPSSVVDIGCGTGEWLSVCSELGVSDIQGIDFHNGKLLKIPTDLYKQTDLTQPFTLPRRFDLAISLEVGEHLPPEVAKSFVSSIAQLAPAVLFSAAIPSQGGTGHVNEQWPDYWASLFSEHGFTAIDCVRPAFWDNPRVASYYAQNTILYLRDPSVNGLPSFSLGRFVHPRMWQDQADELQMLRPLYTARGLVKRLPGALWNSIADRTSRFFDR